MQLSELMECPLRSCPLSEVREMAAKILLAEPPALAAGQLCSWAVEEKGGLAGYLILEAPTILKVAFLECTCSGCCKPLKAVWTSHKGQTTSAHFL